MLQKGINILDLNDPQQALQSLQDKCYIVNPW